MTDLVSRLLEAVEQAEREARERRGVWPRPGVQDNGAVWLHIKRGGQAVVVHYRHPVNGYGDMADLRAWAEAEHGQDEDAVLRRCAADRRTVEQWAKQSRDPYAGLTDEELHRQCAHPAYEYDKTEGPRKAWDYSEDPPEGEGWERNAAMGRDGWERFDYTEESYWRRLRPSGPRERKVAVRARPVMRFRYFDPDAPITAAPKGESLLRKRIAVGPAPYVGRPFLYEWHAATDQFGRSIAGESRIVYRP